MSQDNLIKKELLYPGKGNDSAADGDKVIFHVKTETCTEDPIILDDSKQWHEPVEIILGKKFKLEVWEACVKTMIPLEISAFTVDKKLVTSYPIVARTLRDNFAKKSGKQVESRSHKCCGMGLKEGFGYEDLDNLIKNPCDLKFTIEIVKIMNAGCYEKEYWAMTEEEQMESIPQLKEDGNKFYKKGDYNAALLKYSEAIGRLENLMLKEKPKDKEWNELNEKKIPLLLNYSQCQLHLGDYYNAIRQCSTVLESDPDNIKALFRRGKAYIEVFQPEEARADLNRVVVLDETLENNCKKLLQSLQDAERQKNSTDKESFKKMFS